MWKMIILALNLKIKTKLDFNFENIEYLKTGNDRQKLVYNLLTQNKILEKLRQFDPILVGTIPVSIDIESSDLDIICCYNDKIKFTEIIKRNFKHNKDFTIYEQNEQKQNAIIASFKIDDLEIEIFGQNIPTRQQNAYRHMIIENRLLNEMGELFRQKIIELKKQGYKTEPAFAILLGLKGNAYNELLTYET